MQGREHLRSGQDQEAEADHQTRHDRDRAEPGGSGRTAVGHAAGAGDEHDGEDRQDARRDPRDYPGYEADHEEFDHRNSRYRTGVARAERNPGVQLPMRQARVMSSSGLTNRRPVGGYPKIESVPRMSIIATKATVIGVVLVAALVGLAAWVSGDGGRPSRAGTPTASARAATSQPEGAARLALPSPGGGTPRRCPVLRSSMGSDAAIASVSCASAGNCSAGGSYTDGSGHQQAFVASEAGGTWQPAEQAPGTAALNRGGGAAVASVSCASAGNCSAGGSYRDGSGHQQAFVASETSGIWQPAEQAPGTATLSIGRIAYIQSVSCATAGNCSAGGSYTDRSGHQQAFVTSETSGIWRPAEEAPGTAGLNVGGSRLRPVGVVWVGGQLRRGRLLHRRLRPPAGLRDQRSRRHLAAGRGGTRHRGPQPGGAAVIESVSCAAAGNCARGGRLPRRLQRPGVRGQRGRRSVAAGRGGARHRGPQPGCGCRDRVSVVYVGRQLQRGRRLPRRLRRRSRGLWPARPAAGGGRPNRYPASRSSTPAGKPASTRCRVRRRATAAQAGPTLPALRTLTPSWSQRPTTAGKRRRTPQAPLSSIWASAALSTRCRVRRGLLQRRRTIRWGAGDLSGVRGQQERSVPEPALQLGPVGSTRREMVNFQRFWRQGLTPSPPDRLIGETPVASVG